MDRGSIRQRFTHVDSATVADVLDAINLPHQALSVGLQALSGQRVAGWAFTIQGHEEESPAGGDVNKMQACGAISTDEVSVWAGPANGFAFFGELIARAMAERGAAGAVVQGSVRDLRWLEEMGFATFGAFRSPLQAIGRWAVDAWQVPVRLPGATTDWVEVRPGDFVLGDEDGVVIVPADVVESVLVRAEELVATEVQVRAYLTTGATLEEALSRYGHV